MKALRIHAVGDLRLQDEPMPRVLPDEALVRVKAVGICGSDIHWAAEGTTGEEKIETPFILGHEFGGVVEGGVMDGLRVAVDPALPCETCEFCRRGDLSQQEIRTALGGCAGYPQRPHPRGNG